MIHQCSGICQMSPQCSRGTSTSTVQTNIQTIEHDLRCPPPAQNLTVLRLPYGGCLLLRLATLTQRREMPPPGSHWKWLLTGSLVAIGSFWSSTDQVRPTHQDRTPFPGLAPGQGAHDPLDWAQNALLSLLIRGV